MGHCGSDACFNLASLYEAGYGVTRDLPAALMYYVKAADYPDGHTLEQLQEQQHCYTLDLTKTID